MIKTEKMNCIYVNLQFKSKKISAIKYLIKENGVRSHAVSVDIDMRAISNIYWTLTKLWKFIIDADIVWIDGLTYSDVSEYVMFTVINWCRKIKSESKIIVNGYYSKQAEDVKGILLQDVNFDYETIDLNYKLFVNR